MENKENEMFKKVKKEEQSDIEKEREENEEELRKLQESDVIKGDLHSTDKSDIPLGVEEDEYVEGFIPDKDAKKEGKNESEEYFDTGIRPRVKLPPDESDEWPLIIPDSPLQKEKTEEGKEKKEEDEESNEEKNEK